MATLTVEGIPEALVSRLSKAAAGNGRCLNSEVIVHLARATGDADKAPCREGKGSGWGCEVRPGCRCASRRRQLFAVGWGGPACDGEGAPRP